MFERFTKDLRRAVVRARHEAVRTGAAQIGCEHLLYGVLTEDGPAAQALTAAGLPRTDLRSRTPRGTSTQPEPPDPQPLDAEALAAVGIDLDAVRRMTDAVFGPGALDRIRPVRRGPRQSTRRISFTDEARKSLELALRFTTRNGQSAISTGHMLIGMLDQADNAALDILAEAAIDPAALRADVTARLNAAA
jgi:ATP-dependent Clp protease ATP-binding subunit ClpA